MRLATGAGLGPYEVLSLLGAGGMARCIGARDVRLDRHVALKLPPDAIAGDPQMQQRFEREARAAAALSHPHICAIFDVGRHEDAQFIVMELLDVRPWPIGCWAERSRPRLWSASALKSPTP